MQTLNIKSESYLNEALKKVKSIDVLKNEVKSRCIYTKGVFDILHFGHLSLLSFMSDLKRRYGLPIVIGITCDEIVKRNKGITRPINSEQIRIKQIALFEQVDYVFLRTDDNNGLTIQLLNPLVYIKGMDTAGTADSIQANNPEIAMLNEDSTFIVFSDNSEISTSLLIEKINGSNNYNASQRNKK